MKKHLLLLLILLGAAMLAGAQSAHLRIINLYNFPDTAYEGISYPVQVKIRNVGTAPFQGPLQILLKSDSVTEILYFSNNPNFVLFPNDTVVLTASNGVLGYTFSSQVYKAGSDVVVVWPYSTQIAVTYDTLFTAVYFVKLSNSASAPEIANSFLTVFPNPFNSVIHLLIADGLTVEQVRIFDLFGREFYRKDHALDLISLPDLDRGIYILELRSADKRMIIVKILKQ